MSTSESSMNLKKRKGMRKKHRLLFRVKSSCSPSGPSSESNVMLLIFQASIGPIETDSFPNAKFKVARGSANKCYEFTFIDLPCLNRNGWFTLYNIFPKNKEKYEPAISHHKHMIQSYNQEIAEIDVEVTGILRKKPSAVLKENPKDFEKLKPRKL
ncbi:unnamed protein product [Lactuca saligna]|uniref:Uncharacterized protein n=1 Tax=Lactuca saligna TaxID=75948 RepID=A0AA36EES7_LACSI|nr:unnamed protein product [Lactuca saligna]